MRPDSPAYLAPRTLEEATSALALGDAAPLGGGTDLLTCIQEGLASPASLVDLRTVAGASVIGEHDGGVTIGASARVATIAADPLVVGRFPALAAACGAVGTPALRAMGTIGGNLCQRPRCWYLRRGIPCHKNGGDSCPAVEGENQLHAILGGGPCYIVHPSDTAVALTALEAQVEICASGRPRRLVPIDRFFVLPSERLERETVLHDDEHVHRILVPAMSSHRPQRFEKVMQRGAWDFAVVSVAAARREDGEVRIVLGGVAPVPWRIASSVEEDVASGGLDADAADSLAERALYDARPLSRNAYKVRVAHALLVRAMLALGA